MHDYQDVIAEHGASISRAVASYAAPGAVRDDLSQDVAVALLRALPTFEGRGSLRGFVLRVVHRVCLRAVLRHRRLTLLEPDTPVPDPGPSPDLVLDARMRHERLYTAIRALPLPYRQALLLTLEDLAQSEIATILGISENAVSIRVHRGKQQLKTQLGRKDG